MKLDFTPIPNANYQRDYAGLAMQFEIWAQYNQLQEMVLKARELAKTDLFFLLYFILGIKDVNHPWIIDRITEVEVSHDRTLDLWSREHYKALHTETPILTTNGWKRHIDLAPGDYIFGKLGNPVKVLANTGILKGAECSSVYFDTGCLVASNTHLWTTIVTSKVRVPGTNQRKCIPREEIVKTTALRKPNALQHKPGSVLPQPPTLSIETKSLLLDPYVLGVWLGDGTTANGNITTIDTEILAGIEAQGFEITKLSSRYVYSVKGLYNNLRRLNVLNNKHVPEYYLMSSAAQRLALLQGLMDTDGTCNDRGTAYFVNTNYHLIQAVYFLAASLGMKPHINQYASQNQDGTTETWGVTLQAYKNNPPFRLMRKLSLCKDGNRTAPGIYFKSIERCASVDVNCIQVDASDGVYLAGEALIPTHNSTILTYALTIQELLNNPEERICIFSHTRGIAKAFLRRIKLTFESNNLLKLLFPDVLYSDPKGQSPKWSEDDGIIIRRKGVYNEATLEAWGLVDGMPTSRHYTIRVYDDVVTKDSVSTSEQIRKTDEAFKLSQFLGARGGSVRVIGTRYHFADQYAKMKASGAWELRERRGVSVVEGKEVSVFLSHAELQEFKKVICDGNTYIYNCQMLLDPVAEEAQEFKKGWLRYYRTLPDRAMNLYLFADPANEKKTQGSGSDYTVFWVWGLDPMGNHFLVDLIRERLNLFDRWKSLSKMMRKHPTIKTVYYERYGLQSDIQHFQHMMKEDGVYFTIEELGGGLKKEDRIRKLVPLFENSKVYLPEALYSEADGRDYIKEFVEEEYLLFPFASHDDGLDAASRIKDEKAECYPPMCFPSEEEREDNVVVLNTWASRKAQSRYANV